MADDAKKPAWDTPPMVWVDVDATLAAYDGWKGAFHIGDPLPGAQKFMRDLCVLGEERGFRVGILTTRTKLAMPGRDIDLKHVDPESGDEARIKILADTVRVWLERHGIMYHEVYTGQGKPAGIAYIDDRAVWCAPKIFPTAYAAALDAVTNLLPGGVFSC